MDGNRFFPIRNKAPLLHVTPLFLTRQQQLIQTQQGARVGRVEFVHAKGEKTHVRWEAAAVLQVCAFDGCTHTFYSAKTTPSTVQYTHTRHSARHSEFL